MARIAPQDFGRQQQVLDHRRQELAEIIDQLPEIFGRLWPTNRHQKALGWAIAQYKFFEANGMSPDNPPEFGSPQSRLFEAQLRNWRTLVDNPVHDWVKRARERVRHQEAKGELVKSTDRRALRRADELFEEKFKLVKNLQESRQRWGQKEIDDLRGEMDPANQDWHFVETASRGLGTLRHYVRDPHAKLNPPSVEVEMGQEAALAKMYGVFACENSVSRIICAAHRDLYDPATGIGDTITRKGFGDVVAPAGLQEEELEKLAPDHVVAYIGPPAMPEGVACEAWTTNGRAVSVSQYSMREAHAYRNDYQAYADGTDYLIEGENHLDPDWIEDNPGEDMSATRREARALRRSIADHPAAFAVYQIGHPYHGPVDPDLGRPLNQDTLLATADKNFVVEASPSPAPLTQAERAAVLAPYLPPVPVPVPAADQTLPMMDDSSPDLGSPAMADAAAGQYGYGYGRSGYSEPGWSGGMVEEQFAELSVSDTPSPQDPVGLGGDVVQQGGSSAQPGGSSANWTAEQTLAYVARVQSERAGQYAGEAYAGPAHEGGHNAGSTRRGRGGAGR